MSSQTRRKRFGRHRQYGSWTRSERIALAALLLAAVGAIAGYLILPVVNTRAARPAADVQLVRAEHATARVARVFERVDGEVATETPPPPSEPGNADAIDVTLLNRGNTAAVFTKAELRFSHVKLVSCGGKGDDINVSAEYAARVPNVWDTTKPGVIQVPMRFEVPANKGDRFTISIGPVSDSIYKLPWLYRFHLTLVDSDGKGLDVGNFAILTLAHPDVEVNPAEYSDEHLKAPSTQSCLAGILTQLEAAIDAKDTPNARLQAQMDSLQSFLAQ